MSAAEAPIQRQAIENDQNYIFYDRTNSVISRLVEAEIMKNRT
jgi:hypothetical protein